MPKEKKEVIQNHHILYKEELEDGLKLPVTKREHFELTRIRRYKNLTKNFWVAVIFEAGLHLRDG